MKLTGTNSSIGLITLINQCPSSSKKDETKPKTSSRFLRSAGLVAIAGTQTPDPIPNSEVKRPSANGTASQDVGESVAARPAKRKKQSSTKNQTSAGWSSPVARQAHNLKVAGSNPAPATKFLDNSNATQPGPSRAFCVFRTSNALSSATTLEKHSQLPLPCSSARPIELPPRMPVHVRRADFLPGEGGVDRGPMPSGVTYPLMHTPPKEQGRPSSVVGFSRFHDGFPGLTRRDLCLNGKAGRRGAQRRPSTLSSSSSIWICCSSASFSHWRASW